MAENDVKIGLISKKRACSTNGTIFSVQRKKNQGKKFFAENLHAASTYPLHYSCAAR